MSSYPACSKAHSRSNLYSIETLQEYYTILKCFIEGLGIYKMIVIVVFLVYCFYDKDINKFLLPVISILGSQAKVNSLEKSIIRSEFIANFTPVTFFSINVIALQILMFFFFYGHMSICEHLVFNASDSVCIPIFPLCFYIFHINHFIFQYDSV